MFGKYDPAKEQRFLPSLGGMVAMYVFGGVYAFLIMPFINGLEIHGAIKALSFLGAMTFGMIAAFALGAYIMDKVQSLLAKLVLFGLAILQTIFIRAVISAIADNVSVAFGG